MKNNIDTLDKDKLKPFAKKALPKHADPEFNFSIDSERNKDEILFVDLGSFEGPIDLLLDLARKQKVDLSQLSVLALARQYIAFIEHAKELKLEIAADYLVMAAWLAYLKSRLLLPEDESEEEEMTSEEMASALAFQLSRLEAMQNASAKLMALPKLGQDFYARGRGEPLNFKGQLEFDLKLHDLLNTYGQIVADKQAETYQPKTTRVFTIEDAIRRLTTMLGISREWMSLEDFMPVDEIEDSAVKLSAIASTFGASLELTKQGRIDIKQKKTFAPIYMRALQEKIQETTA